VLPDAMNGRVLVRPGFPSAWDHAIYFYTGYQTLLLNVLIIQKLITLNLNLKSNWLLELQVRAFSDKIRSLKINGKDAKWSFV